MTTSSKPAIKVMCVDDSALIRKLVTELVEAETDMVMVATAPDPLIARELIKQHDPDVLTLDIEMPRMDGLDFLERLMRLRPMPVLMLSSLTPKGSEITMRALALGAVDFITKPQLGLRDGWPAIAAEIVTKIRGAANARPRRSRHPVTPDMPDLAPPSRNQLIAVGASTGGTEALREMLEPLPANMPAMLVTQHMPAGFTASFADRLNSLSALTVKEAEHGERVLPGHVYIAPGSDAHLTVTRRGADYVVVLDHGAAACGHRPSVNVLFDSVARHAGKHAIGVLLTGMGKDGAQGLLKMRAAGALTFAQDEASCVVFGMPREAISIGAAREIAAIDQMAHRLVTSLGQSKRAERTITVR